MMQYVLAGALSNTTNYLTSGHIGYFYLSDRQVKATVNVKRPKCDICLPEGNPRCAAIAAAMEAIIVLVKHQHPRKLKVGSKEQDVVTDSEIKSSSSYTLQVR